MQDTSASRSRVWTYSVQVINEARKSEYRVEKLNFTGQFVSVDTLKESLSVFKPDAASADVCSFGYVSPGHGLKGKHVWVTSVEDLDEMYVVHKMKKEITLWCYINAAAKDGDKSRKRPANDTATTSAAKKNACEATISAVQKTVNELKEKHGTSYSIEKLHAWAHMINIGKHISLDQPPEYPFFGRKKSTTPPVSSNQSQGSNNVTPTKRLGMRTECIDQLSKWHALLQSGAISNEQYEELKGVILKDMSVDLTKQ